MVEVSIIIPTYNEEKYIGKCLESLINQTYPKDNLEILVMDGISQDRTQEIVKGYSQKYPFIKLIENKHKWTVYAFNLGIKKANPHTKYITMLNAHGTYSQDRIEKAISYIEKYNVSAVGGVSKAISRNESYLGKAITNAILSSFGTGRSFRTAIKKPMLADTASGCLYKKEVFDNLGLFNENLRFTQDIEFNKRLTSSGGEILAVPDIVTYYFARSDIKSFCKHSFRNGKWIIIAWKYSSVIPVSLRHLMPCLFLTGLFLVTLLAIFFKGFIWVLCFIILSYMVVNIHAAYKIMLKENDKNYLYIMPVIFALRHITYGLGSMCGLYETLRSKEFWQNFGKIMQHTISKNSKNLFQRLKEF